MNYKMKIHSWLPEQLYLVFLNNQQINFWFTRAAFEGLNKKIINLMKVYHEN